MEFFILWLGLSIIAGVIASKKGRSGFGFFLLAIILSPLIGIIAALVAGENRASVDESKISSGGYKKCPYCAELVKKEARVCRYCGKDFDSIKNQSIVIEAPSIESRVDKTTEQNEEKIEAQENKFIVQESDRSASISVNDRQVKIPSYSYLVLAVLLTLFVLTIILTKKPSVFVFESEKILYVTKDIANVRTGPGTNYDILVKIKKGHELIEIERQGKWINVSIKNSGEKGWIYSSLVNATFPFDTSTTEKPTVQVAKAKQKRKSEFELFIKEIEKLNKELSSTSNLNYFFDVKNEGDGTVQLTVLNDWLDFPYSQRDATLNTILKIWEKHSEPPHPVAVHIVDESGILVMIKSSNPSTQE